MRIDDAMAWARPNAVWHQVCDFLRLVGMRDRLRCPRCRKVGTWKPHGGWLDREDGRKVRRWLCKWCGSYHGPEGRMQARIGATRGWWILPDDPEWDEGKTPAGILVNADPWRG